MKKLSVLAGMILAAAVMVVAPATVKAEGMPCTEATLSQFQANLAAAKQELAAAVAAKAQADANVAALKAQGVEGLQLLQATDAATNAANMVSAYQHKVNGCEASVNEITSRGKTEQYVLDYEAKVKDRCQLDSIKVQLDGQNSITGGLLTQLKTMQGELAKAQANAAANPALADSVAAVQASVNAIEAQYNAAKAKSDALAAQYAQAAGTLNFATDADNAAYQEFVKNYAMSLRKPYEYTYPNGTKETYMFFDNYNKNNSGWMIHDQYMWDYGQPNEWAVRWFE